MRRALRGRNALVVFVRRPCMAREQLTPSADVSGKRLYFGMLSLAETKARISELVDQAEHHGSASSPCCMASLRRSGWHRWVSEPIRRVQVQERKKVGEVPRD